MAIFEGTKARRDRLIAEQIEGFERRLNDWLVEEELDSRESSYYDALYGSYIVGGAGAADSALQRCERLKRLWKKGENRTAQGCCIAFTLAMISAWYRRATRLQGRTTEGHLEACRVTAENVLHFFGSYSPATVANFLRLDVQLNNDVDKNETRREGLSLWGYTMLGALA